MISPPLWNRSQLEAARCEAIARFREERLGEPHQAYLRLFDEQRAVFEELLAETDDLARLEIGRLLTDPRLFEAVRYLAGPPISEDDLTTLAHGAALTAVRISREPDLRRRILDVIRATVDDRRFPWVNERREPSPAERDAAVLASAALLASRRIETSRRMRGKQQQENAVRDAFAGAGLVQIKPGAVATVADAPPPGRFCAESKLGTRKADFIVRLWDNRLMPIECKVSNSSLNSVKRLNNDAAVKAEAWRQDFGRTQVVTVAGLGGVYNLHNLVEAQERGLTIFWAHDLGELVDWIAATQAT